MSQGDSSTIWVISGETSGDMYGARIVEALRAKRGDLRFQAMGAKHLRAAGAELMVDSSELGVMGFWEVLKLYPVFRRIFNGLVERAARERPACVILVDYPGFNVRLAKKLHALGIPLVYYVGPQVWAWGKGRVPLLARIVTKMFVLFPFEEKLWRDAGLDCAFVGHPLTQILRRSEPPPARDAGLVLLLPGSRRSELEKLLPAMLASANELLSRHPQLRFVMPLPRTRLVQQAEAAAANFPQLAAALRIEERSATPLMLEAQAALAASGTVTVEAAIQGLPLVSIYRLNPVTLWLARRLVKLNHFTMPNILAGRTVYQEFLQEEVRPERLVPALEAILTEGPVRQGCLAGVAEVQRILGRDRDVFEETAAQILAKIFPQEASS